MEFETQTTDDSAEDVDIEAIKKIIYELLGAVGEDPTRDGLKILLTVLRACIQNY